MPMLTIYPSAEVALPNSLLPELSKLVAEMTGKSEQWVMTRIALPRPMTFAGSGEPCCYVEFKSVGLDVEGAKTASAALCAKLSESLGVSPKRIYIEFASPERALFGYDGRTLAG